MRILGCLVDMKFARKQKMYRCSGTARFFFFSTLVFWRRSQCALGNEVLSSPGSWRRPPVPAWRPVSVSWHRRPPPVRTQSAGRSESMSVIQRRKKKERNKTKRHTTLSPKWQQYRIIQLAVYNSFSKFLNVWFCFVCSYILAVTVPTEPHSKLPSVGLAPKVLY